MFYGNNIWAYITSPLIVPPPSKLPSSSPSPSSAVQHNGSRVLMLTDARIQTLSTYGMAWISTNPTNLLALLFLSVEIIPEIRVRVMNTRPVTGLECRNITTMQPRPKELKILLPSVSTG
ncbi:hypothetical protein WG66_016679 [Moniliophthora roreri]|nr:hypothetical protein WG66_016679 [Moniliophthora roreri]